MTAIQTGCPNVDDLQQLAAGNGTAAGVEALAGHIEGCEKCGTLLDTLLAKDPTLLALQGGKDIKLFESPELTDLKSRLRQLRSAAVVAAKQTETVVGSLAETMSQASIQIDAKDVTFEFLGPPQQADELGRLSHYRILKPLGAGGMGVVFLAEDTLLNRKVALKTMRPDFAVNPDARARFLREARAAAAVEHDHIITILQVGEDHGVPFLAMPLLKGECLEDRIARGPVPISEVIRIGVEMAEGLSAAHEHGLIHRDIKPGNVWLEGEHGKVKLLDFGLARAQSDNSKLTQSGAVMGTPAYMAPEQARGEELDHRADLFSVGAILYAMLTGRRPFEGENTMNVLMALALDEPTAPNKLNPEISADLSDLTMRLLSKSREKRPSTAREIADVLREMAGIQAPSIRTSTFPSFAPAPRTPKRTGGRSIAIVLACLGSIAILAAGIVISLSNGKGELLVQADDEQIEVTIKRDKKQPIVVVLDKHSQKTIELTPGEGEIEARELPDGLRFKTQQFEIKRGGKPVFTAEMLLAKPKLAVAKLDPKTLPAPQPVERPKQVDSTDSASSPSKTYVESPEFTNWKEEVAKLPPDQQVSAVSKKLEELNSGYAARANSKVEQGSVTELEISAEKLLDISPIRALSQLKMLTVEGHFSQPVRIDDLGPLQGMQLQVLRLHSTLVVNLSPLQGMPLKELEVHQSSVKSIEPLKGMPLTSLALRDTKVSDLSPLEGSRLAMLECNRCPIKDLSPLQKTSVRILWIFLPNTEGMTEMFESLRSVDTLTRINDQSPEEFFANIPGVRELETVMKKLRELNPEFNGRCDYKCKNGHVSVLEFYALHVKNLDPLRELKHLKRLDLGVGHGGAKLDDISPLQSLQQLEWLRLDPEIDSIAPLKGMPLKQLIVNGRNLKDLGPLAGMKLEILSFGAIGGAQISDFSVLKGMPLHTLQLYFTPVDDLSFMVGMPLKDIWLRPRLSQQIDILRSLPTLESIINPHKSSSMRYCPPKCWS